MKKALSLVLFAVLLVSVFAMSVSAAPVAYSMPKATTVPTIDGAITGDEYKDALVVELKKGDASLFVPAGSIDTFGGAKFQFMWGDAGIYFVAEVADTTAPASAPASGTGSYNSGDGIQFNIYTATTIAGSAVGDCLFFSYHPKTADGKAEVGEHFVYGDGASGGNVPEAKVASVMNGNSYVIEGLIPKEAFAKLTAPITLGSGSVIYMNSVVMEMDDAGTQSLIIDNTWFDGSLASNYTLVDTAAGPSPEAPTDAAPTTPDAPQTSDAGVFAILGLFVASAVAFAVVKKSKNRA
ncbi:MAG: hypothetical protein AB9835_06520 [Eubacteriales bacterium]